MDYLKILVSHDLLATFVNLFTLVFTLDFVSNLAHIIKGGIK